MLADRKEAYKNWVMKFKKTEKQYKETYTFLKDASSRALQQSKIDLDMAYKNFFRNIKKWKKPWFPKFKSKHSSKLSYREPQTNNCIKIKNNKVTLLKLWKIKFRWAVKWNIRNITITKEKTGNYTASVLTEYNTDNKLKRNWAVWVDVWIKHIAVTSDGNLYTPYINEVEKKIKRQQRHIARKVNWSKWKQKAIRKLNRLHTFANNKKNHFEWHLVKDILGENQTLCIESLNVKGMMKNRCLSGSFQKRWISWLLTKMKNKCEVLWMNVIEAPRFYPSSKRCNNCLEINTELKLSDRTFNCSCWAKIQRDFNASLNLRALSGEYSDYRDGENIRLIEKSFDFSKSSFLWSPYLV